MSRGRPSVARFERDGQEEMGCHGEKKVKLGSEAGRREAGGTGGATSYLGAPPRNENATKFGPQMQTKAYEEDEERGGGRGEGAKAPRG
eukprot:9234917-Pyramimonas_sp.AAC.1